jgi:hypothetical protein
MTTKKTTKKQTKKETRKETFKVSGENLVKTVKELIAKGNVRHITIKDKEGKVVVEFPLTIGVVATALLPVLAAIGAMAALIGECTIAVEVEK